MTPRLRPRAPSARGSLAGALRKRGPSVPAAGPGGDGAAPSPADLWAGTLPAGRRNRPAAARGRPSSWLLHPTLPPAGGAHRGTTAEALVQAGSGSPARLRDRRSGSSGHGGRVAARPASTRGREGRGGERSRQHPAAHANHTSPRAPSQVRRGRAERTSLSRSAIPAYYQDS